MVGRIESSPGKFLLWRDIFRMISEDTVSEALDCFGFVAFRVSGQWGHAFTFCEMLLVFQRNVLNHVFVDFFRFFSVGFTTSWHLRSHFLLVYVVLTCWNSCRYLTFLENANLHFKCGNTSKHVPAEGNGKIRFCKAVAQLQRGKPQREDCNETVRNDMCIIYP